MKKPTPLEIKAMWDTTLHASNRRVAARLVAQGFTVDHKVVERALKKMNSGEKPKKPRVIVARAVKVIEQVNVARVENGEPPIVVEDGKYISRLQTLRLQSLAQNQVTLQNTGLIAAIIVAEQMVEMIDQLTVGAPGDVARLLHAVTEATQVKHVGGAGQVPAADDPNVIDVTPNKTDVRDAVDRFRKSAGL